MCDYDGRSVWYKRTGAIRERIESARAHVSRYIKIKFIALPGLLLHKID